MTLKSDAKFEEKLICCFRNDKNFVNFEKIIKKFFQKFTLWLVKGTKVYNVWPKKVQRSYFMTLNAVKFQKKKTGLWVRKWQEEFGKFSPERKKVSKFWLWWDPFIQNRKFTEELCVMTIKNDVKFGEELICHFKIDIRSLTNLKNLLFNGLFLTKVYNV